MSDNAINRLLGVIEIQLGWGPSVNWSTRDFEKLNILIQEKTKISLSSSTLRRIWGKADYKNQPSLTTLDTLAQFAGFEDWKKFSNSDLPAIATTVKNTPIPKNRSNGRYLRYACFVIALLTAMIISFKMIRAHGTPGGNYRFEYRPVTRDIPNSVVFTYNAGTNPGDSAIIQQSWDKRLRSTVSAAQHSFVSTYYRPGFFLAKLIVDKKIVKECPLLIPTNGWLALIDQLPTPFYLSKKDFLNTSGLSVSPETLRLNNIALNPKTPTVEFYNVGNFRPVPLNDFYFSTEVKDDYSEGSSRCQQISVRLITDASPIDIPLSAPGCIGELSFSDGNRDISGSTTDLSGFGVNQSNWIKVTCSTTRNSLQYYINDKLVYECVKNNKNIRILGIAFSFHGTGMVRHLLLRSDDKIFFKDFN